MTFTAIDHVHMAHALRLAERGLFTTQPNPRVGCVIAHGAEVIGTGWHQRAGEPHAEVFALREAGDRACGATAYVTLEPCAHVGRTPPCVDALIAAGVARIVVASEDTNPKATGGAAKARAAGIGIESGLMRDAARELNRGFFLRVEQNRPWVRVKLALSLDGRTALANGDSKWITGEPARADVQRWRARSSAILTGTGTARADDPRLTVRLPVPTAEPLRVVLDRDLSLARGLKLLDGSAPTLVLHAETASPADDRYDRVERASVGIDADGALDLAQTMHILAGRGVNELQVEAGPTLCGNLFEAGLVDEFLLYVAPVVLGDTSRPLLKLPPLDTIAGASAFRIVDDRRVGNDRRLLLRE
ncbi:MAG TPA: bifunctional diaminohydroxyphosphoribosylaminopyrimidine deaminase/5-amino-6-(5-phosphoribosylamino)uracil reductase RibD [Rudaea sp.]